MPATTIRRPAVAALSAAVLLAACGDDTAPVAPTGDPGTGPVPAGIRALRFLPPLPSGAPVAGAFDATLAPVVEVCRWAGTACVGAPVARFTTTGGTGGARVVVEAAQERYRVDWKAERLTAGAVYRIRVLERAGGPELGHVDGQVPGPGAPPAGGDRFVLGPNANVPIRFRVVIVATGGSQLPGDAAQPAAGAIPRLDFQPRAEDYAVPHAALPGVPVSHNTLLLRLAPDATIGAANALLAEHRATIVGGIPAAGAGATGLLAIRIPAATHAEMDAALAALRADARVRTAVQDVAIGATALPRPDALTAGADHWRWDAAPAGGNWGMELVRAPQLWNLNEAVRKALFRTNASAPLTGVLDVGFADAHDDLAYEVNMTPGRQDDHGTGVAGIIGATFDNGVGVDGLDPFARLVVRAPVFAPGAGDVVARKASAGQFMLFGFENLLRAHPETRVVNMSLGYNWGGAGISTATNAAARRVASEQGALFAALLAELHAELGRLPQVVVSAGNDSHLAFGPQEARWSSPMANAALEHGAAAVIVVEAVGLGAGGAAERMALSNLHGTISAPGARILTTSLAGYSDPGGTSQAAPHVAGLLGYLHTLAPALPSPTPTANAVRDLLLATAVPVGGGASARIDAFGAALALDGPGEDRVLRMLVDVDDGTIDGNARLDANGADLTAEDVDGDGGPGDGRIDMSDFRRWRDWLLQAEGAAGAQLDGSPRHAKKDVNGNGRFAADGDDENLYPRGDFNGDGLLSRTATRAVPGAMGGRAATDLAVLQALFDDPDHDAGELPGLLESADLTIDATACLAHAAVAKVRTRVFATGGPVPLVGRTHDRATPVRVYTEARDAAGHTVLVEALAADGTVKGRAERDVGVLAPGADAAWTPSCASVTIAPSAVTLKTGETRRFTATVIGAGSPEVAWQATGGQIDATGLYTAPARPGTYQVIARSVADTMAADTAVVQVVGRVQVRLVRQSTGVNASAGFKFAGCTGDAWPTRPPGPTIDSRSDSTTVGPVQQSASATWSESFTDHLGGGIGLSADATANSGFTLDGTAAALTAVRGEVAVTTSATWGGNPNCIFGVGQQPRAAHMIFVELEEPAQYALSATCTVTGAPNPVLSVSFHGDGSSGSYVYAPITPSQPAPRRGTIAAGTYFMRAESSPAVQVRSDGPATAERSGRCAYVLEFLPLGA